MKCCARSDALRAWAVIAALACAAWSPACSPGGPEIARVDQEGLDPMLVELLERLVHEAESNPQDGAARGRLGVAYEANQFAEAAGVCYEQAQLLDPAEARWWYHSAVLHGSTGDLEGATARIDSALARDMDYAPAWWRRGNWWLALGDVTEAERSYRRTFRLKPNHPAGPLGLARVYLQQGDLVEAERLILQALERRPHGQFVPYLRQLLGSVYRQAGRLEEAKVELAAGHPARPEWNDRWREELKTYQVSREFRLMDIQLQMDGGDFAGAAQELEKLRERFPNDPMLLTYLGVAYQRSDQLPAAREILEEAVEHGPEYAPAWENLAVVLALSNDLPGALRTIERSIELDPRRAPPHAHHGAFLLRSGRMMEALAAYDQAIERDPTNLRGLIGAATILGTLGRWEEAAEHRERVLELAPDDLEALLAAAEAHLSAGSGDRAEELLDRAAVLAPDDARVRVLRGHL